MEQNPYLMKSGERLIVTDEGRAFLSKIVTDSRGPVYAFTEEASPLLVAAAMARLSRRGSDLREIYLDEFAISESKAEALIDRVVTAYGDDSVQQLMSIALVVEDASNILTKKLEWGRLAAYLEQSTRYIYYDTKDSAGHYRYYTPSLPAKLDERYRRTTDAIFELYSEIVRGLTEFVRRSMTEPQEKTERIAWLGATRAQACDAARPALPASVVSTVGIVGSAQAIESLVLHLASEKLRECQEAARRILDEARKVAGSFLKRADMPERGGAMVAYIMDTAETMRGIAQEKLSDRLRVIDQTPVALLDYWPKDELDLIPEMLFAETNIPAGEIGHIVNGWSVEKKTEIFRAYIGERLNRRHKPGRAVEKAHYEWQIVGDYGTFRDLQRHRMVDMWEWQRLTPDYGYEVPNLVVDAGFADKFIKCFSLSSALYQDMKNAGFEEEASYAVLLGHRLRYRFMINAREAFHIHELRTSPQGHPGYRKIVQEMHRQLSLVHPLLGEAMRFVNMGEDPGLTRLAAERATQKKLSLLEKAE